MQTSIFKKNIHHSITTISCLVAPKVLTDVSKKIQPEKNPSDLNKCQYGQSGLKNSLPNWELALTWELNNPIVNWIESVRAQNWGLYKYSVEKIVGSSFLV